MLRVVQLFPKMSYSTVRKLFFADTVLSTSSRVNIVKSTMLIVGISTMNIKKENCP